MSLMGGKLTQVNGRRMAGGKPIPDSDFALPGEQYPVDTVKRARNALSRVAQNGTPDEQAKVRAVVKRKWKSVQVGGTQDHANAHDRVIELDWSAWDAGHKGGDASAKAHATASATARAHMQSHHGHDGTGSMGALSALHDKMHQAGQMVTDHVHDMQAAKSQKRAWAAVDANHMYRSTGLWQGKGPAPGPLGSRFSNDQGGSMALNFADDDSMRQCPNCGYRADDADFQVDGGASGTTSPNQPEELRTPQPSLPNGGGMPLTVRGASSGSMGLASRGGRVIGLARRMPVRQPVDLLVSRAADGTAIIRHRQGGNEVARMQRTQNGWQPVVDGKALGEHRHQRNALLEAVGVYNSGSLGQPLQPPPQQTALMQQYGVPAIRLATDDTTDDDNTDDDGLTAKGQQIYKKLTAKGIAPKVALAMAKRSQNAKPGSFSTSTSKAS